MKRKMMAIVLLLLMAAALPASAQETWEPTSESIVGMWACAGANDTYPFLVFYPDGTAEILDYGPLDPEDEIFYLPGEVMEQITYEVGEGTLSLSIFEAPLPLEAIVTEEELETDSQIVEEGTEGFVIYEYVEMEDEEDLIPMEYVYYRMEAEETEEG